MLQIPPPLEGLGGGWLAAPSETPKLNFHEGSNYIQSTKILLFTSLLQIDYAKNYTCRAQDEVQSAHWNQGQVKLLTSISWFRGQIHPHVVAEIGNHF